MPKGEVEGDLLELLGVLGAVFPSFAGISPGDQATRAETLGIYLAQGWSAGAARMKQVGLDVPPEIVNRLAPPAQRVVQMRSGGATFLVHLRQALGDDGRFQRLAVALGTLYARSRPPGQTTPSGAHQAVAAGGTARPTPAPATQSGAHPAVPRPAPAPAPAPEPRRSTSGLSPSATILDATVLPLPEKVAKPQPSKKSSDSDLDALDFAGAPAAPRATPDEPPGEGTGSFNAGDLSDLDPGFDSRPTSRPPAPTPGAGGSSDFLSSLVGGGLIDDAPAAPPPPAPRPAAPAPMPAPGRPTPAPRAPAAQDMGRSWENFESALASGGDDIFLDDNAPKGTGQAPPPAPAPKPAAPPSSGGLDLLPDEPAEKAPEPDITDKLLAEAQPPPAAPPEPQKRRPSGRFKSTAIRVQEFNLEGELDEHVHEDEVKSDDELTEDDLPKDPAQAALVLFERTGDPQQLAEARKIFTETLTSAPHGTARAFAEAGLAKVQLLAGNAPQADQQARAALERDPGNPFAVEVIVRVGRGEAERSRLSTGLAQARFLIAQGRRPEAHRLIEQKLAPEHPDCPQPWLLLAYLAKGEGDDARFEEAIAEAWQRMPGKKHGDLPLGGTVDVDLASLLAWTGRGRFKTLDPEFLKRTVENVDSRDNTVAGTFRLAIGVARIALARGHLARATARKAWMTIAAALVGLQYYDAAVEALDRASRLRPDEKEAKSIDVERRFAQQMRRAFDKPGVKAQMGKYNCVGTQAVVNAARDRLAAAAREKAERESDLLKAATEIANLVATDPHIREEVRDAAQAQGRPDPIEALELAAAELAAVRDERARLADPAKAAPEKKGLFSKLASAASAAADKVAATARDAQLKMREIQVNARREDAIKKLGMTIAKDLRDHAWNTPQLKAFARRAASLEAFADYHSEEERLAKVELEGLAKSV